MVLIKPFIPLFNSFWEEHQPTWRCSMYLFKFSGPSPKLCLQTWQNLGLYFTPLAGVLGKESFSWKPPKIGVLSWDFLTCSSTGCFSVHRESQSNPPLLPFRNKLFTENHRQQNNSLAWLPTPGSAQRDSNKKWKLCAELARITLNTPLFTSAQVPDRALMHHITANTWAPNTAPATPKMHLHTVAAFQPGPFRLSSLLRDWKQNNIGLHS